MTPEGRPLSPPHSKTCLNDITTISTSSGKPLGRRRTESCCIKRIWSKSDKKLSNRRHTSITSASGEWLLLSLLPLQFVSFSYRYCVSITCVQKGLVILRTKHIIIIITGSMKGKLLPSTSRHLSTCIHH